MGFLNFFKLSQLITFYSDYAKPDLLKYHPDKIKKWLLHCLTSQKLYIYFLKSQNANMQWNSYTN